MERAPTTLVPPALDVRLRHGIDANQDQFIDPFSDLLGELQLLRCQQLTPRFGLVDPAPGGMPPKFVGAILEEVASDSTSNFA